MPSNMTSDIYRHRKPGDMCRILLIIERKRRYLAAKALRTNRRRTASVISLAGISRIAAFLT